MSKDKSVVDKALEKDVENALLAVSKGSGTQKRSKSPLSLLLIIWGETFDLLEIAISEIANLLAIIIGEVANTIAFIVQKLSNLVADIIPGIYQFSKYAAHFAAYCLFVWFIYWCFFKLEHSMVVFMHENYPESLENFKLANMALTTAESTLAILGIFIVVAHSALGVRHLFDIISRGSESERG